MNNGTKMTSKFTLPVVSGVDEQEKMRFQIELEFVQCLANPNYLNFLAQRGYLKEQNFINYLKYLLYWREHRYAKYLKYPQCLHMLDLLQYEHFRQELASGPCARFIDDQQLLHWQHYHRLRTKLFREHQERMRPTVAVTMADDTATSAVTAQSADHQKHPS